MVFILASLVFLKHKSLRILSLPHPPHPLQVTWVSPAASGRPSLNLSLQLPPSAAALVTQGWGGRGGRFASLLLPGELQPTTVSHWQICFQIDFREPITFTFPTLVHFVLFSGFSGTPDAALEILYFGVRALKVPVLMVF